MRNLTPPSTSVSAGGAAKMNLRNVLINPTKNLLDSVQTNNVSRIKSAINMPCIDFNVRIPSHEQMTIPMRFCYLDITSRSRIDLTKLVMDKDCELNAQDVNGKTVLTHACIQQDQAMVKILAEDDNVDPNIADDEGNTPLMYACRSGNAQLVTTLVTAFKKHGLNVNETNNEGISPLIEAACLGHTDVCRTLVIDGKADVSQRDTNCNSAKDYLVSSGRSVTPDLLLLCPTAQRKYHARQRRVAEGRRIMSDLALGSTPPHTAWLDDERPKITVSKETPLAGMSTAMPFTREHIGQLNSIVFQMAKHVQMVIEQPLEEDMEDVERVSSKLYQRRHSSYLPDLQIDQESVSDRYFINDSPTFESSESLCELNLSPQGTKHRSNGTILPSMFNELHKPGTRDGHLRLQPIDGQHGVVRQQLATKEKSRHGNSHSNENPLSRRRLSVPPDIPRNPTDNPRRDRLGSIPAIITSLSSPIPKANGKQNGSSSEVRRRGSSPSSRNQQSGRRLNDSADSPPDTNRLLRRRSSMPQLSSLPNNKPPPSSSLVRRVTYPGGTKRGDQRHKPNERELNLIHSPRAVESRVSTSWGGKSSKKIPSYLFR